MGSANADTHSSLASITPAPTAASQSARLAEIVGLASTGIDIETGLASDFLNQFNEVSMLLDMAADDAEMLGELDDWAPRDYVTHFEASNFRDAALVLEAYGLCPGHTRARFDQLSGELATTILSGLGAIAALEDSAVGFASQTLATEVRTRIDALSAIIHPAHETPTDAGISALFAARR